MRPLNSSEKRTIRLAALGLTAYLTVFGAIKIWQQLEHRRAAYAQLITAAQDLKRELQPYPDKILATRKLMENFQLDPAKLSRPLVVAEASAALQQAAAAGGIQVGPIHEAPAQAATKALATIQFEGSGPVAATMALLQQLPNLGYPLIIDSVQIASDPGRPGQVKINLTISVLDFDQWKEKEAGHA
ncbi:MAG TPA: hypothetical protein VL527_08165 [Dongiaceae bacterium]|nr:hypothetical protein [Dongiaceae bacterium]